MAAMAGGLEAVIRAFSLQVAELREATLLRVDGEFEHEHNVGQQLKPPDTPIVSLNPSQTQPKSCMLGTWRASRQK